ncbi:MAG: HAMP domain-containing histidine kinase, partial [Spartobacteria bacterium]|nr:HAMP domain-containing histidine kinase [Spartobacteria bacterium]
AEREHAEKSVLLEKLQENYDKLKDLEKLRDELVHMIVHDMKAPLQVIMSSLELLAMAPERRKQLDNEKLFGTAMTFSERLLDMANSLLDVSRMEAGSMTMAIRESDILEITQKALVSIEPLIKGQQVRTVFPGGPLAVRCDPDIIHRVLINLLSNAVKYTHAGDVVQVEVTPRDREVCLAVSDSGPGIAPEFHSVIFEKFGQVKTAHAQHHYVSTGLGLTFCKLAVEEHRGAIGVDSEEDRGSRFWFTLPRVIEPVH